MMKRLRYSAMFYVCLFLFSAVVSAYSGPLSSLFLNSQGATPVFAAYFDGGWGSSTFGNFTKSTYNVRQGTSAYDDPHEIWSLENPVGVLRMKTQTRFSSGSYRQKANSGVKSTKIGTSGKGTLELCLNFQDLVSLKDGLLNGKPNPVNQSAFNAQSSYTTSTSPNAANFGNVGFNVELCTPSSDLSNPENCKAFVISFVRYDNPNGGGAGVPTNAVVSVALGSRYLLDKESATIAYAFVNLSFGSYHRYTFTYDSALSNAPVLFYIDGVQTASFPGLMIRAASDGGSSAYGSAFLYNTLVYRAASCKADGAHYSDVLIDSEEYYDSVLVPVTDAPGAFSAPLAVRENYRSVYEDAVSRGEGNYTAASYQGLQSALAGVTYPAPAAQSSTEILAWTQTLETALASLETVASQSLRAEYENLYETAASKSAEDYTEESFANLQTALSSVAYPAPAQAGTAEVLSYLQTIQNALDALWARGSVPIVITSAASSGGLADAEKTDAKAAVSALRDEDDLWYCSDVTSNLSGEQDALYGFAMSDLKAVKIRWYQGGESVSEVLATENRAYDFRLQSSSDGGRHWTTLYSGVSGTSSATQTYSVSAKAHLLRLVCTGNTGDAGDEKWFSFREISVYGTATSGNSFDAAEYRRVRVACLGDSITYGSGSANDRGTPGARVLKNTYPGKLQALFGCEYQVTNYGISGAALLKDTTWASTKNGYLASTLAQDALETEPDIVIILLGTNDSKERVFESMNNGGADFPVYLEALYEAFAALPTSPEIYFVLPPPVLEEGVNGGSYGIRESVLENTIRPMIRAFAAEQCCPVIDPMRVLPDVEANPTALNHLYVDGVHPNEQGYALIASEIHRKIVTPFGDANEDGNINVDDMTLIARHLAGWEVELSFDSSDANDDALLDLDDMTLLARYLAGWRVLLG